MEKENILKAAKTVIVIVVIVTMVCLGVIFTDKYKSKLDKTKPVFKVVEEKSEKVIGKITSLLKKENNIEILIENSKEEAEDKVDLILSVDKTTVIKNQKLCKISDVEIGDRVEALYEIPVEGEAKKIAKTVIIIGK